MSYVGSRLRAHGVVIEQFEKLDKIPNVMYYRDYVLETPAKKNPGNEQ